MGFIPSGPEVWIILVIILIVFGAGKLPEIGGALGKGIHEFPVVPEASQRRRRRNGGHAGHSKG